jgi:hypothetical protein
MKKFKSVSKETLKEMAWNSARAVPEHDPATERLDACGAWIHYADFENHDSDYGWEIDHVYPISKLRSKKIPRQLWNHSTNIRAMHWKNNQSKANSYPYYLTLVESKGDVNIDCSKTYNVEESLQYSLRCLFKLDSKEDL